MTELADTAEDDLVGVNQRLCKKYTQEVCFHAIVVCFDITSRGSFDQALSIYKDLLKNPADGTKLSHYAKIPCAFVGTKLDLTDFARSDSSAVPRAIKADDLNEWLHQIHKRAENACFEVSSKENIGV